MDYETPEEVKAERRTVWTITEDMRELRAVAERVTPNVGRTAILNDILTSNDGKTKIPSIIGFSGTEMYALLRTTTGVETEEAKKVEDLITEITYLDRYSFSPRETVLDRLEFLKLRCLVESLSLVRRRGRSESEQPWLSLDIIPFLAMQLPWTETNLAHLDRVIAHIRLIASSHLPPLSQSRLECQAIAEEMEWHRTQIRMRLTEGRAIAGGMRLPSAPRT